MGKGDTMGKEIGIDFGTTTTEVSYINKNGHARSMKLEAGKDVIPTVLYFKSENEYIIGKKASSMSRINPKACVKNFKLYFTDPTKKYKVKAENGDEFTIKPVKVAQLYLNSLIQIIQPKLLKEFGPEEGTIDKAVITVPAQFDPEEKEVVKNAITKAASMAGFSDIKVAAEPTAAAVAFQEENCEDGETILVYDFGGGTFDVSVIQKEGDIYKEISTDGDKRLGGNLLTEQLAEVLWVRCLDEVNREYPFEEDEANHYSEDEYELSEDRFKRNRIQVFNVAEEMKIEFQEADEVNTQIPFYFDNESDPKIIDIELSLDEFNEIIYKDVNKTVELTYRVLNNTMKSGKVKKVDQLVLAGGSSQLRLVNELLLKKTELKELVYNASDSSTLIARGAAKLASVELKVEERTRFEIGTRVIDGTKLDIFEPFINVGEKLPCSGKHRYYLTREGQTEVTIEYYEKDIKNYPNANRIDDDGINLVNKFTITGIPIQKDLSVMVTFNIEVDGTPTITAEIMDKNDNTVKADKLSIDRGGNLY